jgi:hypothetical protein
MITRPRGVLPTVARRCMWLRNLVVRGAHSPRWASESEKQTTNIYNSFNKINFSIQHLHLLLYSTCNYEISLTFLTFNCFQISTDISLMMGYSNRPKHVAQKIKTYYNKGKVNKFCRTIATYKLNLFYFVTNTTGMHCINIKITVHAICVDYTGSSKKMDAIWNSYNLKNTGRIYTFGVLKCLERFKVLGVL